MSGRIPRWIGAVEAVDRGVWYAYRATEIVRDEVLRAFVDEALRDRVTARAYARQAVYLPGGARFEEGLFAWEERALSAPPFPREGRVLLAAAGGGRELRALLDRGLSVTAFEPSDYLRRGAEEVARGRDARVLAGAYADLPAAARGAGPLATLRDERFDAVVLGWGSITHLTRREEHMETLTALSLLAPGAPVLLSFFLRKDEARGRSVALRRAVRRCLTAIGGRRVPEGVGYEQGGGFVYWFTALELHELAMSTGYRVEALDVSSFPHATLVPHG
ncbi:MAG: hypothetical protein IT374_02065 [Polyangiaceae bacterium]|nr:hypothetical protein [Polyangiaceae bacterium]